MMRTNRTRSLSVLWLAAVLTGTPAAGAVARQAQAGPAAASASLTLDEVLAHVRAAVGHERSARAGGDVLLVGDGHFLGLDSDFSLLFSPGGRFLRQVTGPLGEATAFDGETAWGRDRSGVTRLLELGERDRQCLVQWVHIGYWLDPDGPVDVALEEGGADEVLLRLTVRGTATDMELRLDPATWLPRELALDSTGGRNTWTFEDHRDVRGLTLAHHVLSHEPGGSEGWLTVREAKTPPPLVRSPYQMVRGPLAGTSFDPDVPAELDDVERVFSGHLLVHPVVDGEDVGWFILDSGAGAMCMNQETAEELGLEGFGEVVAVGAGGRTTASFAQGTSFQLGPLTMRDPVYVLLDLAFLSGIFGRDIGGVCGYDVFARAVVEIDAADDSVWIHDPRTFELDGTWQELFLDDRVPLVEAAFEGHRGLFKLDTGSDSNVIFHAPAVERLGLLEGRAVKASVSGGVGGLAQGKRGEIAWFELGGHRYEKPKVEFSQAELGALTDEYSLGNLGQGFLRDFRLVFDYPDKRIALVPLD